MSPCGTLAPARTSPVAWLEALRPPTGPTTNEADPSRGGDAKPRDATESAGLPTSERPSGRARWPLPRLAESRDDAASPTDSYRSGTVAPGPGPGRCLPWVRLAMAAVVIGCAGSGGRRPGPPASPSGPMCSRRPPPDTPTPPSTPSTPGWAGTWPSIRPSRTGRPRPGCRRRFPLGFATYVEAFGATPMITWQPQDKPLRGQSPSGQPDFSLAQILTGRYDTFIRSWADQARGFGHTVYVRLMHEMNGCVVSVGQRDQRQHPGPVHRGLAARRDAVPRGRGDQRALRLVRQLECPRRRRPLLPGRQLGLVDRPRRLQQVRHLAVLHPGGGRPLRRHHLGERAAGDDRRDGLPRESARPGR